MTLGRVIGTVWATRKDAQLTGLTLQLVEDVGLDGQALGAFTVAVDSVGAGVGETVLVVSGSSARMTEITKNKPVDAVIVAIVDTLNVEG